jgi:hypothetical protein
VPRLKTTPLDDQLCFALYSTNIALNRAYKPMLDAMGITYPQYLVLNVLGAGDGTSVGAIARFGPRGEQRYTPREAAGAERPCTAPPTRNR